MSNYDENSIRQLNWREAVRSSIGMYIGAPDTNGMHHLLEEIVANAMDEAAAGYGNRIEVSIDTSKNQVSVQDYGRGVPFRKNKSGQYAILEVYQGLHAGGKFDGDTAYKSALGLNGVGGTVTNALSTTMFVRSVRVDGTCEVQFLNGEGVPNITSKVNQKTGTLVSFVPDPAIFGDLKWDLPTICEKIQYHALLNNGLEFVVKCDGKEIAHYKYSNGIKELLKIKAQGEKTITSPIYNHVVLNAGTPNEFDVEYAFQFIDKPGEHFYAFTNGGYNPDEGTHVTGFRSGLTSLINKKAKEFDYLKSDDKNYDGSIVRRGLLCVLSVKMLARPQFAEQTKLKLTSPAARGACSQAIMQLELTKAQADEILKKVQTDQKAEDAAKRAREAAAKITRGGKNLKAKDMPEKLADCQEHPNGELFLTEGDSAAGGAKISRDPKTQAVLALRGKIKNTYNLDLADTLESDTIKQILTCLGCGIGENFNISNLRYDKILILSDADPDGSHIQLLIEALFLKHLPELVKAGKVYRVVPPLYRVTNNRGIKYYYSEAEARNKSGDKVHYKGLGEMSARELYETCLNPETRHLIQLKPENYDEALKTFDVLMGNSPESRRNFISKHKISGEIGDVYEEEGDAD